VLKGMVCCVCASVDRGACAFLAMGQRAVGVGLGHGSGDLGWEPAGSRSRTFASAVVPPSPGC
jgi:hypothetical protein